MLRKLLYVAFVALIATNILLGGWLIYEKIHENEINQQIKAQQINEKVLVFTKLFVQKVLQGQDGISFEDRLQLENAVRDLNDQSIFNQWQKFTKSQNNTEAQQTAGSLFDLLLDKISF